MNEEALKYLRQIRNAAQWILIIMILSMLGGCIGFMNALAGI